MNTQKNAKRHNIIIKYCLPVKNQEIYQEEVLPLCYHCCLQPEYLLELIVLMWLVRSVHVIQIIAVEVVAKVNGMLALVNTLSNFISSFPHYSRQVVICIEKQQSSRSNSKQQKYSLIFPLISSCRMIYDWSKMFHIKIQLPIACTSILYSTQLTTCQYAIYNYGKLLTI